MRTPFFSSINNQVHGPLQARIFYNYRVQIGLNECVQLVVACIAFRLAEVETCEHAPLCSVMCVTGLIFSAVNGWWRGGRVASFQPVRSLSHIMSVRAAGREHTFGRRQCNRPRVSGSRAHSTIHARQTTLCGVLGSRTCSNHSRSAALIEIRLFFIRADSQFHLRIPARPKPQ